MGGFEGPVDKTLDERVARSISLDDFKGLFRVVVFSILTKEIFSLPSFFIVEHKGRISEYFRFTATFKFLFMWFVCNKDVFHLA